MAEPDGQRAPGRVGIGRAQRRQPGGVAGEHADQVDVGGETGEHGVAVAVRQPPHHADRLERPEVTAARQAGLDRRPQPLDEGMQPGREQGDQAGARVLPDHVELVCPEHRQLERLREEERAAGLHEHPHGLGPRGRPAVAADHHGVAARRIEQLLPGAGRLHAGDRGGWRGREVPADRGGVAAPDGGLHQPLHLRIPSEQTELHANIILRAASLRQPRRRRGWPPHPAAGISGRHAGRSDRDR
jgi:hypothetical protein